MSGMWVCTLTLASHSIPFGIPRKTVRQSGYGGKGGGAFLLRISMSMDHLHNRLTFDLGNKKEINYHS